MMLKCQIAQHRRCQDFRLEGANHKLHALTSSETSKEEFLRGQRHRRMKDQKPWPGVGTLLGTRSRRWLKQIPKVRKCLNWETRLSKDVYCKFKRVTDGGLETKPRAAGRFFGFFLKKKLF